MRITVTIELYEEATDESDHTGLTEDAYMDLHDAIGSVGEIVDIRAE